jgi:hypothetical protein
MFRVNVVVEGQTEETFIRDFLAMELSPEGIFLVARSVETGKKRLKTFRGGLTSYAKAKKDITQWLNQDISAHVTTMFDLYALPPDFPGFVECQLRGVKKSEYLETKLKEDIKNDRFIPYIQTHEFESLLFSDSTKIDQVIPGSSISDELQKIRKLFPTPEDINEGNESAPSKRILSLSDRYDKILYLIPQRKPLPFREGMNLEKRVEFILIVW